MKLNFVENLLYSTGRAYKSCILLGSLKAYTNNISYIITAICPNGFFSRIVQNVFK